MSLDVWVTSDKKMRAKSKSCIFFFWGDESGFCERVLLVECGMTRDERCLERYNMAKGFIEDNKRNPRKHSDEKGERYLIG